MGRFLIWFLLLSCSVAFGLAIHRDSGYLLLAYENWVVEMPLWLGGGIFILTILTLGLVIAIFQRFTRIGEYISKFSLRKRQQRARRLTNKGLVTFAEGRWSQAERCLIKAARHSEAPLLNYLTAARAAQALGALDRRDRYLRCAHDSMPGTDIAVGLSQAQLQLNHGQFEQCLATLTHLRQISPGHLYVLKLLVQVYISVGDWEALEKLLPEVERNKVLTPAEFLQLEKRLYTSLFEKITRADSLEIEQLSHLWQRAPKSMHADPKVVSLYVQGLHQNGKEVQAEQVLRQALKTHWEDDWIALYGRIKGESPQKQLSCAENWLKTRTNNPVLLLALGRLSLRCQLWGKAQRYFETSLGLQSNPEVHAELGRLLERLGKSDESAQHYRRGLLMAAPVISLERESIYFSAPSAETTTTSKKQ